MRPVAVLLLLAGAVPAGQSLIRAERRLAHARAIVAIAESKSKPAAREALLDRARPAIERAQLWLDRALRDGEEPGDLAERIRALAARVGRGARAVLAPTDRLARPIVPRTGTVVIVSDEPETEVIGTGDNARRVARRQELIVWRMRRIQQRVGTRAIEKQRARLGEIRRARAEQLRNPTNIGRLTRRAELNRWRLQRVMQRAGR